MCAKEYEIYGRLNPLAEEAFKVLRTNIQFYGLEEKIKTLTIVSCNHNEGKTSVAINLAISTAIAGKKVLLVDADLRKPTVNKRLGGKGIDGLSAYLTGEASLAQIVSKTSINNLFYISGGPKPPNPSELIASVQFTQFIKTVEGLYEMIIIDTSTLGSVIDAAVIASQTDGTLIVVSYGSVQAVKAKRMKEQLENVNARIIGVVLNKVDKRDYKLYNSYYKNFSYYFNPDEAGLPYKS